MECRDIKKYYGSRLVVGLEELRVYSSDRIGIVGVNGSGKTTLVNMLCQRLEPDEGWVRLYGDYSYISQLEPPEVRSLSTETASKFGVSDTWNESMSGGEQTRFKLAACFGNTRMMIFADEPTSNVDMKGIELMEDKFAGYEGAIILVSHDRSLLDKICSKILEIENGRVKLYSGNYSDYCMQKEQEKERARFEYIQYTGERKRLEEAAIGLRQKSSSVRRAPKRMGNSEARLHKMGNQKAKASLERARKSIATRIEQLEVKEKPADIEGIRLDMADIKKIYSKIVIEGSKINKAFGNKVIFKDAGFTIMNGSKTALIGPNGCGKTTLVKMILDRDPSVRVSSAARIGYFSQDMSILDEKLSVLENVMKTGIYNESIARTLLARLLFKREDVYKPAGVLSGGERVKAAFAKILMEDINLLILDEPTNYLDIPSVEAIEEALCGFDRTLLLVSHDRSLIGKVADSIITIENYKINVYNGTYEEYLNRRSKAAGNTKEDIEKQIMVLQNRLSDIIGRLSMPSKKDDLEALDREYKGVLGELKRLKEEI